MKMAPARTHPSVGSVVVVTPWFPNRPDDQNAAYIFDSAAAISRAGAEVSVLVCRPLIPKPLARLAPEWMRGEVETSSFAGSVGRVVIARYPSLPGGVLRPLTNAMQRGAVSRVLDRLVRQTRAGIIHAQTEGMAPIALAAGRKSNVPVVATIHGLNMDPHYLNSRRQRALLAPALHDIDRLVLVGEPLRQVFSDYAGRRDHVRVVPNGVRLPQSSDTGPKFSDGVVRIVSVSNLHEGKGIDVTLDALAELRRAGLNNWSYTIVGGGAELERLKAQVQAHSLAGKVTFLGPKPHREVFDILECSDVFVLPSYREAFGIAYLEAMACGLTVIGVKGQGPQSFMENGRTGYLVEPRSPHAVAECLKAIFADPEAARAVGDQARLAARSFTWDAHADRLMSVFAEVAASAIHA
jgi:glycosyltransferase involved in cell wall biosynthesis